MGKNKLSKFADMDRYPHVFQFPYSEIKDGQCPMRGHWHDSFFGNNNPIVLELGCGRAEYSVDLARQNPSQNFIAVDIKGSRMWTGATASLREGLKNIAFLRTNIEIIDRFFAPEEISEIWITFPDPQMKKPGKRLTSTGFLECYRRILVPDGIVHLKTDSNFMFTYTRLMTEKNSLPVVSMTDDLYASPLATDPVLSIKTYYERQWLDRGISIKYIAFRLPQQTQFVEPDEEIEFDEYRSYNRNKRSELVSGK